MPNILDRNNEITGAACLSQSNKKTDVGDNELVDSVGRYKLKVDISVNKSTVAVGCEELVVAVCGY